MKNILLKLLMVSLLFIAALSCIFADSQKTIAILDFAVQSDNPDYTYLGKGFAEFISVELDSIPGITMVDRSIRNELLKEQAFSLSGFGDDESAVEIGNLLSARYLISGEIFEMFSDLVVTVKLVNVETGKVVTSAKADGPPKLYKTIIRDLTNALSSGIAPETAMVQPERKEKELDEEEAKIVLTSFSEAVDAVDNDEVEVAKIKLKEAQKIDRTNKAIQIYLSKLQTISPKFNVELIYYAPSMNPALLGFLEKDRAYFTININEPSLYYEEFQNQPGNDSHSDFKWQVEDGSYYTLDQAKVELGYAVPVGEKIGIGLEFNTGNIGSILRDKNYGIPLFSADDDVYITSAQTSVGGRISLGYRLNEKTGIGLSGFLFNSNMNLGGSDDTGDPKSNTFSGSSTIGVYWKPGEGRLNLDSSLTVPFLQEVYLDYDEKSYIAYQTAPYPIVWEGTDIYTLKDNKIFLAGKEVLEIYTSFGNDDRTGVASRSISSAEYYFTPGLSMRLGG